MIFPESAYPEHAETNDTALLIHALHDRIAPRGPHVTVRIGKGHFEIINFRVKPQFYFVGHNLSPNQPVDFAYRYAALQINGHDPNRVSSIDRDGEDLILRFRRLITRPPSRWSAALAEHPSLGSISGIGDPETTHKKIPNEGLRQEEPYLLPSAATKARLPLRRPGGTCGPNLAAQCATDQFSEAHVFAARFIEQELLDVSREAERHRHTACWQLRSGHEAMCIIVSYTSQD
jgi:hypothetical protein